MTKEVPSGNVTVLVKFYSAGMENLSRIVKFSKVDISYRRIPFQNGQVFPGFETE